jgi:hypothetical protein
MEGRDDYKALEPLWEHFQLSNKVLPARADGGGWSEIVDWARRLQDALQRFRLPSTVFVLLDNDGERDAKLAHLGANGFSDERGHVWNEREIESYLILPTALSRISATELDHVNKVIAETPGRGKARFEAVLRTLGMLDTPKNLIVRNALVHAPEEIPSELSEVPRKIRRLLGLSSSPP